MVGDEQLSGWFGTAAPPTDEAVSAESPGVSLTRVLNPADTEGSVTTAIESAAVAAQAPRPPIGRNLTVSPPTLRARRPAVACAGHRRPIVTGIVSGFRQNFHNGVPITF